VEVVEMMEIFLVYLGRTHSKFWAMVAVKKQRDLWHNIEIKEEKDLALASRHYCTNRKSYKKGKRSEFMTKCLQNMTNTFLSHNFD
jgi:hypothetical protein